MSMISEQVNALKDVAEVYKHSGLYPVLREAADTIETLSAKVQAANMERSDRYYNGGWIPCSNRLPEPGIYLVTCDDTDYPVKRMRMKDLLFYDHNGIYDGRIYAWMPLPEPYHEP